MGKGVGESSAGAAPMDVFAQAEALNAVSKTYDVEIDGVPLQRMSTVELSKLAASRGLPPSHARGELIGAIARDELDARERRGAGSTNSRADDLRDVDVPDGQFGIFYYGANQVQVAFGNGFRCVGGGNLGRLPVTTSVGGVLTTAVDNTNPPYSAVTLTAGSIWNFQAWFRDPADGGAAFNLSNGLEIGFLP